MLGDLEYFASLGMPYPGDDRFCWLCTANKDTNPWNDFANGAGDPNHWSNHSRFYVCDHPLFAAWGVTIHTLALDVLHTVDLGVAGHAVANLFYELIYEHFRGTIKSRITRLWERIRELYEDLDLDHRISNFKLRMFVKDEDSPHSDFPFLSHAVKAAEARSLARVGLALAREYENEDVHTRTRLLMFKNLNRFYDIVGEGDMFLTVNQSAKLIAATDGFLACYQFLARNALDAPRPRKKWSTVNKHHMFWHLSRELVPLNPRWVWCYQPEDYQRWITMAGAGCAMGSSIYMVPHKLCERVRVAQNGFGCRQCPTRPC